MWKVAIVGVASGAIGALLVLAGQGFELHVTPVGMSYADLAATALSAVAVLTTVVGLFIAALAVWGFTALRGMAKSAAKAHVSAQLKGGELRTHLERVVTEFLSGEFKDGKLRELLESRVDAIMFSGPSDRAEEEAEELFDEGATEADAPDGQNRA